MRTVASGQGGKRLLNNKVKAPMSNGGSQTPAANRLGSFDQEVPLTAAHFCELFLNTGAAAVAL